MIILDTNVVSELIRAEPSLAVVQWVDAQPSNELHITAVTLGEILFGIARLPKGRRRTELADAVEAMVDDDFAGRVVAFDGAAAAHFGHVCAVRERAGRPISTSDAIIAAICRSYGATLATRNVKDFARTDVTVVNPWE